MNFGSSRITRLAEAVYNQPEETHPVVVIEGMNHMQFATDFKKEDLKPYIPEGEAQLLVARVSIDWTAKEDGVSDRWGLPHGCDPEDQSPRGSHHRGLRVRGLAHV